MPRKRDWLLVGRRLSKRAQHLQSARTIQASKTDEVGSRLVPPPPPDKWARVSASSGTGPCPHFSHERHETPPGESSRPK
ncbi:hypothetical protein QLX08_000184 [Tetragonisca angustula]|uniref:Uncharacterized protein n=1 Tax=Tetragonisca angustula TaxID=166442 RepID=A0AAW1AML2_9HYME